MNEQLLKETLQELVSACLGEGVKGMDRLLEKAQRVLAQSEEQSQEPLFLLHCGKLYDDGEQQDWDIEADSGRRVDEFCKQHPGKTVKLYPCQDKALGPVEIAAWSYQRLLRLEGDAYPRWYDCLEADPPLDSWETRNIRALTYADKDSLEQTLHLGACIVDGMLEATLLQKSPNGSVLLVAAAEMEAGELQNKDCVVEMRSLLPGQS